MIPFHLPYLSGNESKYIQQLIDAGIHFSGDGEFTALCTGFLEELTHTKAMLTTSCTHALEMAAILIDVKPGDEIIMSPFTFASTANAFELRGAKIVYCDIHAHNLNIDETLIEELITDKTKAIVPMHYAGVGCNMKAISEIARNHGLFIIEDAAQCIDAYQDGRHLGTFGDIGCLSFHETKNIHCGEGGAILINNKELIDRAEIIREKGTNKSQFLRGQIPFYSKVDIGSSYLISELNAAFLWAQLQDLKQVTRARIKLWNQYFDFFQSNTIDVAEFAKGDEGHNAHIFWVIANDLNLSEDVKNPGHYQLLSSSGRYPVAASCVNLKRLSLTEKGVESNLNYLLKR